MPDKKHIIDAIASIARELGHAPSRSEFIARSGITMHFVLCRFRGWNDAVRAAGLQPHTQNVRLKDRALLEDWGRQVRRNRGMHSRYAQLRQGEYDPSTIERRFGRWSAIPEAFRKFARGKPEWADVLALLPVRRPKSTAEQKPVSAPAGSPNTVQRVPLADRPFYGNPTNFQALRHEPVNEQGVVLLFGMLAKELGFLVEAVQKGFPDCEAKRQTGTDRWQRVSIEFEFESRNFRDHRHPLYGCDLIVCWRHNWPECPRHIEVLELSSVIKCLSTSGGPPSSPKPPSTCSDGR
ncbi:MAG TPA: hypothetical protein VJN89_16290 [Candidatus Acidoferrum sp.]|nr:hypothetical protein [Candidatus Acidoferrum sp.]